MCCAPLFGSALFRSVPMPMSRNESVNRTPAMQLLALHNRNEKKCEHNRERIGDESR